ncbi:MAG: CheR family methyltransferase [Sulfurimonas sp.]|nr:CheR family methyltransferase [Sulfurimonas sp.]MDQ7068572.1 CheR family methyltransferase [Sulfurimonas sp.]
MFDFFKVQKVRVEEKKVTIKEDFQNIDPLCEYFKKETGIDFENQKVVLKSKVATICKTHKIFSFSRCMEEIETNYDFKQELINYLTTNESFFYREFHQIEELVQKVKASYGSVKILCAPSANGEEPYSIAIALFDAGLGADKFHITGIDISSNAIAKSKEAIYNQKALRHLNEKILNNYFSKKSNLYHLDDKVKNQVDFQCINIFEKEFELLGKFDYIFSRNMLIYFDYPTRRRAHALFIKHLKNPEEEIFFGHADLPNI